MSMMVATEDMILVLNQGDLKAWPSKDVITEERLPLTLIVGLVVTSEAETFSG